MKKKFLNVIAISALVSLGALTAVSCNPETPIEDPVEVTYKVTYDTGNYTVSGIKADGYKEGDTVTFTVTAASGYEITSVSAGGTTLTPSNGSYSFTMGSSDVKLTITATATAGKMTLDKTELIIDEVGKSETITATLTNLTGEVAWEITDDVNFLIEVSEDTLSCTVINLSGGQAVITATIGDLSSDVVVRGSTYGDTRETYTIHKADGSVLKDDVKGFYNAVGQLNNTDYFEAANGYVTKKGETDVLYKFSNAYLSAIDKDGPTKDAATLQAITSGEVHPWNTDNKTPLWYANYQLDVDLLENANVFNTLLTAVTDEETGEITDYTKHANFNTFDKRAVDFGGDLFLDKTDGFYGRDAMTVWSGWRASEYLGAVTTAEYVSWADAGTWDGMDLNFDLSGSTLIPSYNEDQGVFAQLYLGSTTILTSMAGMYFDAGTMEENMNLADGTTRDIYTFKEKISQNGGLTDGKLGEREIGTTSIGKAVWDSFNKVWTFPDVSINLHADIYFTGEDPEDASANYHRVYTISGYKGDELVNSVSYDIVHTAALVRTRNEAGEAQQERSIYGVSFTPEYDANQLPDITCGAKWSNIVQTDSVATKLGDELDQNIQFVVGRTVNSGCQTGLLGSDCVSMEANSEEQSVYNFYY